MTDLATGACFHFFACGPGIHADDDCSELVPSMADLAKAIGFSNDPATDEEIAGVRLSSAEQRRAARSVIEPTEGGADA